MPGVFWWRRSCFLFSITAAWSCPFWRRWSVFVVGLLPVEKPLHAITSTAGTWAVNGDCDLAVIVEITGELLVNGDRKDMHNLVAIKATSDNRHFQVTGGKLTLEWLKLTRDENRIGGGVQVEQGELFVTSCFFHKLRGGGIYASSNSQVELLNTDIHLCRADDGGGGLTIRDSSTLYIRGGEISNNTAPKGNGGGVYCVHKSNCTLDRTILHGNIAIGGGGVYLEASTMSIQDSTIDSNQGENGGGVYVQTKSSLTVDDTIISNNRANNSGGGFIFEGKLLIQASIHNTLISHNMATCKGGGVSITANSLMSIDISRSTIRENEQVLTDCASCGEEHTCGFKKKVGGGGLYIENDHNDQFEWSWSLRESEISDNKAGIGQGHQIYSYVHYKNAPAVLWVNVHVTSYTDDISGYYFGKETGQDVPNKYPEQVHRGCSASTCSKAPFTGECSYVNIRVTCGCSSGITSPYVGPMSTCAMWDGDVAAGEFDKTTVDLILNKEVEITATLTIVGRPLLTTIKSAAANRHFQVRGGRLWLKNVKLVGSHTHTGDGGAVNVQDGGIFRGLHCWLSQTRGHRGGAIIAGKETKVELTDTNITLSSAFNGGGVYVTDGANVTLLHASISSTTANESGGGVYVQNASLHLSQTTVTRTAAFNGGGVYVTDGANVTLLHASISSTTANESGGGVYVQNASLHLSQTTVTRTAAFNGGGVYVTDGANVTLLHASISSTTANESGGGVYVQNASLHLSQTTVTRTAAFNGGGVYVTDGANVTLLHASISSTTANESGGGVYVQNASLHLSQTTVTRTAAFNGGGVYVTDGANVTLLHASISSTTANESGGGVYVQNASLHLSQTTVTRTAAFNGGGVYVTDGANVTLLHASISSTTANESGGGVYVQGNAFGGVRSTVVLTETIITQCSAKYGGGAAAASSTGYSPHATVYMYASTLSDNVAKEKGGAVYGNNAQVHIVRCYVQDNKQSNPTSEYGGGGLYVQANTIIAIHESSLYNNFASSKHGHQIMSHQNDKGTPERLSIVNTNISAETEANNFFGYRNGSPSHDAYVGTQRCDAGVTCIDKPFTASCFNLEPRYGILCSALICPRGSYTRPSTTPREVGLATVCEPEWNCNLQEGVFNRTEDCTLLGTIDVVGALAITGRRSQTVLTSPGRGTRHFEVKDNVLKLKWLTLVGNGPSVVSHDHGGGISLHSALSSLTVVACVFLRNFALHGGAIYAAEGALVELAYTDVTACVAEENGGGIFVQNNASISLTNSSIRFCKSRGSGGALHVLFAHATVNESIIENNTAFIAGGGVFVRGNDSSHGRVRIIRSMIRSNRQLNPLATDAGGGGIYAVGHAHLAELRQSSLIMNTASSDRGHEMLTVTAKSRRPNESPMVILVNIYAVSKSGNDSKNFAGPSHDWTARCRDTVSLCTESPYTGVCLGRPTAAHGVACLPVCSPRSSGFAAKCAVGLRWTCRPGWNRASGRGEFNLTVDTTLDNAVDVVGPLSIVGRQNLTTVIAAERQRHFSIWTSTQLTLTRLKLTGARLLDSIGGSIRLAWPGASLLAKNCFFQNNVAISGGAIASVLGSHVWLFSSNFTACVANETGGALRIGGAATLHNVRLHDNRAGWGGGLYAMGGVLNGSDVYAERNGAFAGGGMFLFDVSAILNRTHFVENTARNYGGGAFVQCFSSNGKVVRIYRAVVRRNEQTFEGHSLGEGGGGVYVGRTGRLQLRESLLDGNIAKSGHGHQLMLNGTGSHVVTPVIVANTEWINLNGSHDVYGATVGTCSSDPVPCTEIPFVGPCDNHQPLDWQGVKCGCLNGKIISKYNQGVHTTCSPPPRIIRVEPSTSSTLGNVLTSFYGENFGDGSMPASISINGRAWTNVTYRNASWITAVSVNGTGGPYPVRVNIGGQASVFHDQGFFSYAIPEITDLLSPPFKGGRMCMYGNNFGVFASLVTVLVDDGDGLDCKKPCTDITMVEGGLCCQFTQQGVLGSTRGVTLIVDGRTGNRKLYRYDVDRGELTQLPLDASEESVREAQTFNYTVGITPNVVNTADVNVHVIATPSNIRFNCSVTPTLIVFKTGESTTTYTISVQTSGNLIDEGPGNSMYRCDLVHTVVSMDEQYNKTGDRSFKLNVINDDVGDIKLWTIDPEEPSKYLFAVKTIGPLCNEEGGNISYGMRLETEPRFPVTVWTNITLVRAEEQILLPPKLVAEPSRLVFGKLNWNTRQRVQLRSIEDKVDHNTHTFRVLHIIETDDAIFFERVSAHPLMAIVDSSDNDEAGVVVETASPILTLVQGQNGQLATIKYLTSRPVADVMFALEFTPPEFAAYVTVSPTTPIVVAKDTWANVSHVIEISAKENAPGGTVTLRLAPFSIDKKYNNSDIGQDINIFIPAIVKNVVIELPKRPVVSRDAKSIYLFHVNIPTNSARYEIEWSQGDETFADESRINSTEKNVTAAAKNTLLLSTHAKMPLALEVVYVRVRVLGPDANSAWSVVSEGWEVAANCDVDYEYLKTAGKLGDWRCVSCPEGGFCRGDSVTWKDVRAKFGWWRHFEWTENSPSNFTACAFPPACLGAPNEVYQKQFEGESDPAMANAEEGCAVTLGYAVNCTGAGAPRCRLCATCAVGYRRREIGGSMQCDKCPDSSTNKILLALGVVIVLLILGLMVIQHMNRGGKRSLQGMQKVVIINYFQLTYMIGNMSIPWPEPLKVVFQVEGAISTIGEHLLNPACELTEMRAAELIYQKQVAYLFVLPALIVFTKGMWRLHACWQGRPFRYRGENMRSPSHKDGERRNDRLFGILDVPNVVPTSIWSPNMLQSRRFLLFGGRSSRTVLRWEAPDLPCLGDWTAALVARGRYSFAWLTCS